MESQNRTVIVSWIVPSAILMFVVAVMLFNFSTKSSKDAAASVSRNLIKSVQGYGENFIHELELVSKVAVPMRTLLERGYEWEGMQAEDVPEILAECSDAYEVILCDASGEGINEAGEEVSIGGEEYFQLIHKSDSTAYVYVEGAASKPSVVVAERINGQNSEGYLLLFYPMERFKGLLSKSDFDSSSFLVVVDSDGKIIGASGATDSKVLAAGNILEAIRPDNADAARTLRNRMDNGSRGTTPVTVEDESCVLAYAPVGVNRWEVILGVSQIYVDKQESLQWQNAKNMLLSLLVAIFAFIAFVMIINIGGKIRNNNRKKELEDKADTDLLTGLTNKLATERKIKEYMAQNPESQCMMFMVDIDNFKKINDTMGHAFGDEVLRSLGQQIGALFRATDIIGRVGGDEFMIFLKGVSEKEAIRKEAKKVEYFFNNFQAGEYVKYAATASIGVAVFPHEGTDFESLYKAADQGVYKAKKRGKNQLAFYRDEWMQPDEEKK